MMNSNYGQGGMIPQSPMYQARSNAIQAAAQDAQQRLQQRQGQAGENVNAGANVLGQLAGAIIGGLMTGGPGAIPGAAIGGQVGGLAGKAGQMIVDPNQRNAQNVMGMMQQGYGAANGYGGFMDKYGSQLRPLIPTGTM